MKIIPLLFLTSLLAANWAQAECDYDDFPLMPDMLVASIGSNIQWNQTPMAGRSFRVPADLVAVKDFYAEAWADEVDFSAFNGWEQILHINQQCMMMIQVKRQNDRYSYGQLVITNPPASAVATPVLGDGMPVPPGAQVISDMRSDDDIRQGRLVLLLNEDDMNTTAQWYETELKQQGWSLEQRSQQANGVVLSYSRERELMTVGLLRHQDKTQVLVNRMDR